MNSMTHSNNAVEPQSPKNRPLFPLTLSLFKSVDYTPGQHQVEQRGWHGIFQLLSDAVL